MSSAEAMVATEAGGQRPRAAYSRPAATDTDRAPILWGILLLICIFPGTLPVLGTNLYYNHVIIALGFGIFLVGRILTARVVGVPRWLYVLLAVVAIPFLDNGMGNYRFVNEQVKLILVLVGSVATCGVLRKRILDSIPLYFPLAIIAIVIVVYYMGLGDYYGDEGRFGVPLFGSPNSTAYVVCVAIIFAVHGYFVFPRARLVHAALALVLVGINFWTGSDGGILMLFAIFLTYVGLSIRNILLSSFLLAFASAAVASYLPRLEVPELIGSGRLFIWNELLDELLASDWWTIAFGYGPGAIEIRPYFTALVQSAHSTYLEILYSYGLVGLLIFLAILVKAVRQVANLDVPAPQKKLVEAILLMNIIGGMVDSYIFTAQLTWLAATLVGIIGLAWFPGRLADDNERSALR